MKPTANPGLYIHLPFCSQICPYCDFYVLTGDAERRRAYFEHLLREIEIHAGHPWPKFVDTPPRTPFDTLYLGGGTPSLIEARQLAELIHTVQSRIVTVRKPWIGLEANPEDVTPQRLSAWKALGVCFLSLGIQSFDDRNLTFLGRRHDAATARQSAAHARDSGIETISFDLIYGLPEQTGNAWHRELETAVDYEPDHLSCYQLTYEPRTPFGFRRQRGELGELGEDQKAELFLSTHRWLGERGLEAYEVSSFAAKPVHQSHHNIKYWQHIPYLGLGPSAHSFAGRHRWWNVRKIKPYLALLERDQLPMEASEALNEGDIALERLMLGLRRPAWLDLSDDLGQRIWHRNHHLIETLAEAGLLEISHQALRPTLDGLAVADDLVGRFDPPTAPTASARKIC